MSLKHQVTMLLLSALLLPGQGRAAAPVYKDDCRAKIDELLAKQKTNREKIQTLKMTGTMEESIIRPTTRYVRTKLQYDYQQSGINRRVDLKYEINRGEDGNKFLHEGRTAYWVHDGKRTLTHISDTALTAIAAENNFDFQNAIGWLDDLHRGREARSHANFLRWLMDVREKKADDQQVFAVVEDTSSGRALPAIDYTNTKPTLFTHWRWVFDPKAGYEVVQAVNEDRFPELQRTTRRDAHYTPREIAPDIFRIVTAKVVMQRDAADHPGTVEVVINNATLLCNGPPIPDETFTFTAMGVKPGAKIGDLTHTPTRQFILGAVPLSGTKLDAALKAKDAFGGVSRPKVPDTVWRSRNFQGALIAVFIGCVLLAGWMYLRRHETRLGVTA
jgi:hypothetical protein